MTYTSAQKALAAMITDKASHYGFKVKENPSYILGITIYEDTETVSITYREELVSFTKWNNTRVFRITFAATIAKMGGYPTTDELHQTADIIHRAASLVDDLNGCEYLRFLTV